MPRKSKRVIAAERAVKLVVKRCATDLAHRTRTRPSIKIGKQIGPCGTQGCVFNATLGGKQAVVKITAAGKVEDAPENKRRRDAWYKRIDFQHEIRRRSGRSEYDDYTASLKVRDLERMEGTKNLHPMLPRFKKIGVLQDCLREKPVVRGEESPYYEDGPAIAHLAFREDLPNLPPALKRAARRAQDWIESLERAMSRGRRAQEWMDSHRWKMREDLHRHPDALWFVMGYYDLQKWLEKRGAFMYDMHEDNFGVRCAGRSVQVVVRDIGRLSPLPHRHIGVWKKAALERRHGRSHLPLAGYDGGD